MATPFVLTAQVQTQLNVRSVKQTLVLLRKSLSGTPIKIKLDIDDSKLEKTKATLDRTRVAATQAGSAMEGFGRITGMAGKRFLAFSVAASGFIKLTMAFKEGIDQAIKFDREMVRLSQVTGKTVKALSDINREVTSLATNLGVSSASIMSVTRILAQTGMTAK